MGISRRRLEPPPGKFTALARLAVRPEVRAAGGKWQDIDVSQAHADGTLVTAAAWPAHPAWLAKFLEVLGTRIQHEAGVAV
jgi:protease I